MVPSVVLWALYSSGSIRIWMLYSLILVRGIVNAFDNPARQSIVGELVGRTQVVSAVSLNASLIQAGRLLGPAAGALIIATLGLGPCFLGAASTYGFMVVTLLLMRPGEIHASQVTPRGKGQIRAGVVHVAHKPELRVPLVLMAVVGLLAFNFNVALPAVARFTYHGTATTYALMMNFLAGGALVGALLSGMRTTITRRTMSFAALAFGVTLGLAAVADNLWLMLIALIGVGASSVTFSASVQAAIQLAVEPEMRGRVLSLYQALYQGSTPIGSIIVGAMAAEFGARSSLALGSVAALLAGAGGVWGRKQWRRRIVRPVEAGEQAV
jgi:MFS family permease